ncbi:SAM-dependent methyltransferase [Bordetella genomosp. 13]|uniref:SAM-dependent methyltransferase n=1 Tax=Bordetella genomosp. 13 TaxID=463040 RepID=UPI0011A36369|nr:class I SAM-dependent methyltransferase [Bordetella genomosp. 13]
MPVTTSPASLHASAPPRRALLLAPLLAAAALAWLPADGARAQSAASTYEPSVGQAGKDVVWVPTSQALVERMLDIAKVSKSDYLIDLGSGDGRTVITAAKRGLTAHGIEYNPDMTEVARKAAAKEGVTDKASFATGDLFEADLSRAQVITMFLLPSINERLRPVLLDLKPGTRVVSNTFRMGDWQPDETATVEQGCQSWCTALLWIVPAKVEGSWKLGDRQLTLTQQYQMLSGTLGQTPITDARMTGNEISFNADGVRYTGTVDGKRISGKGGSQGSWTATRT